MRTVIMSVGVALASNVTASAQSLGILDCRVAPCVPVDWWSWLTERFSWLGFVTGLY